MRDEYTISFIGIEKRALKRIFKKIYPDTTLVGLNRLKKYNVTNHFYLFNSINISYKDNIFKNMTNFLYNNLKINSILFSKEISKSIKLFYNIIFYPLIHLRKSIFIDAIVYKGQSYQKLFSKILSKYELITYNATSELYIFSKNLGISKEKLIYLPWGIDTEFYKPIESDERIDVLSVGSASRDYLTLAKAINKINNKVNAVIVTGSSLRFRKIDIRYKLIDIVKLNNKINIVKNVEPAKLRELYATSKIVVVPIYPSEAASGVTSLLESMAMKKPIICTESPGLIDYINADGVVTVKPFDEGSMANFIVDLIKDENMRKYMGKRNFYHVNEKYTTEIMAKNLAYIIKNFQWNH